MAIRILVFDTQPGGSPRVIGGLDEATDRATVTACLERVVANNADAKLQIDRLRGVKRGSLTTSGPEAR